jgi:5-(carboxyamino)imidazole ribonucleotide synthase
MDDGMTTSGPGTAHLSIADDTHLRVPLGILGGGQLARMTAQAAATLGFDVVIAERFPNSPAARMARHEIVFARDWDDPDAIARLARHAPTITLESEFVDAGVLDQLQALGSAVWTTPDSLRIVQDKLLQKEALVAAGIPVAPFRSVQHPDDLAEIGHEFGWPVLLKTRRDGYDGYGNALVGGAADAQEAFVALGWPERRLMVESFIAFERELAVIVVRGQDGREVVYPVVETQQDATRHICRVVLAPAAIPDSVSATAAEIGRASVRAVGGVGTFGVEMFHLGDGSMIVNELAPRPHNSGHYSIEACLTSQFANHVRAVLGLPLGDPSLRAPFAVMVNLLGEGGALPDRGQIAGAMSVSGTFLHLYGKAESRAGRKMGHITAVGESLEDALQRASLSASRITT